MFDLLGLGNWGNYESRKVANDCIGDCEIDTARVADGKQPYETGIKDPRYSDSWVIVEAYDSKEEAEKGHAKWVKIMSSKRPPKKLVDCVNAAAYEGLPLTTQFELRRKVKA